MNLRKCGEKSCVGPSCRRDDGDPVMMLRKGGVGCIHPGRSILLEVHHNHDRCVYYAYLWMSDLHSHDVLNDQNGLLVASQTSQSPLGPNDRLFKTKTDICHSLAFVFEGLACRSKPCKINGKTCSLSQSHAEKKGKKCKLEGHHTKGF